MRLGPLVSRLSMLALSTAATALMGAATTPAAAPVAAPAAANELVCRPNYDFCVEVNGTFPPGARFFNTLTQSPAPATGSPGTPNLVQERGKFFIDIPSAKDSLLMDLQAKMMFAVPRGMVEPSANDDLKVKDPRVANDGKAASPTAYAFSIDGPIVECQAADNKIRVMPVLKRPPVIGPIAIDALIADRPEYRAGMQAYTPHKAAIDGLIKSQKPVELEVYFATWCPHCKMYIPKLLRVLKDANNPNIKTTFVGVPQMFVSNKGPWQDKQIQTIPTVIVKIDGREITRMGTHEGAMPEDELSDIIKAVK